MIQRHGADQVAILTIRAEENDRLVGHLETKVGGFRQRRTDGEAGGHDSCLLLPGDRIAFCQAEITRGSWEHHYKADLRNMLDGTQTLNADYVIGSTNHLARLGAPLLSRFQLHRLGMSLELAEGILSAHWPEELSNGFSSEHVVQNARPRDDCRGDVGEPEEGHFARARLDRLQRPLPHSTWRSDIKRRMKIRRRKESQFNPDQAFVDEVLHEHLEAMLAPAAEAAGTRKYHRVYRPKEFDPHDLPVTIAVETRLVPAE